MKILHCLHNYHPARGGSEWLMQNVSERLVARGHTVKVIATNAYSTEDYFLPGKGKKLIQESEATINGVSVKRVPFTRKGAGLLNILRKVGNRVRFPFSERIRMTAWGPRSRDYSREILASQGFELIAACPLPTLNIWYAWRAAQKSKRPFVIIPCFHTEDPWTYNNRWYFRMLSQANAVITLTDWERDHLLQNSDLDPKRIHTLGVGIDIEEDASDIDVRTKYGIQQKSIVLFLGQHGAHKGIIDLIYAMRFVWESISDVALVIAGNPTAHTQEIKRTIKEFAPEQQNRIYLIEGFSEEEKRPLFNLADVFVSVSAFESFGIVFLEAWREKLPVIGCRRGGAARLIKEFENGLKVQPSNSAELAGALLELLDNPISRRKMGENGYKMVAANYSWDAILAKWENLYHDVLRTQ